MICVKAVAMLLSLEPRHAMYRSSDTLALLAMFAALGLTALLAPAWCAPGLCRAGCRVLGFDFTPCICPRTGSRCWPCLLCWATPRC